MFAIYRRELRAYFTSPIGYLLIAFLLFINGIYFSAYNLQGGYSNFSAVLYYTLIVLLLFCPLLTMRTFSEERRQRTDQLLLCAPVRLGGVVLAKFLSALTVLCVPLAVLCTCPLVLSMYGPVELGLAYAAIFGYLVLGAACIAVGIFFSSVTENQIIAALLAFAALLAAYLMEGLTTLVNASAPGALAALAALCAGLGVLVWYMTRSRAIGGGVAVLALGVLVVVYVAAPAAVTAALGALLGALSLFGPFYDWLNGILSLPALVYYLSVTVLFLFLTVQSIQRRRYN